MWFLKIAVALFILNSYAVALSCESIFSSPSGQSPNDGYKKINSFPDIDSDEQRDFEQHLSIRNLLTSRFSPLDQCHKACAPYSFARLVDYVMEGVLDRQISPAYILAKTFEEKFRLEILSDQDYLTESSTWKMIALGLKRNGLLFEDEYPSDSQVNTPLLFQELKKLSVATRGKFNAYTSLEDRERMQIAALNEASQLIQSFLGAYSDEMVDNSRKLFDTVKQGMGVNILVAEFPEFVNFAEFSSLMLENSIPILLTYNAAPRMLDRSGQYIDYPSVRDNLNNLHGLVIVGEAIDESGSRYFIAENSHANARRIYIHENYLLNAFRSAYIMVDTALLQKLIEVAPRLRTSLSLDGDLSSAFFDF